MEDILGRAGKSDRSQGRGWWFGAKLKARERWGAGQERNGKGQEQWKKIFQPAKVKQTPLGHLRMLCRVFTVSRSVDSWDPPIKPVRLFWNRNLTTSEPAIGGGQCHERSWTTIWLTRSYYFLGHAKTFWLLASCLTIACRPGRTSPDVGMSISLQRAKCGLFWIMSNKSYAPSDSVQVDWRLVHQHPWIVKSLCIHMYSPYGQKRADDLQCCMIIISHISLISGNS